MRRYALTDYVFLGSRFGLAKVRKIKVIYKCSKWFTQSPPAYTMPLLPWARLLCGARSCYLFSDPRRRPRCPGSCNLGVTRPDVIPEFIAGSLSPCAGGRDHSELCRLTLLAAR
jgi:hypothetical protein